MINLLIVLFAAVFVNNCVFQQIYGICPFLGVSKRVQEATGMGVAVTFVMLMATAVTWPIQHYLLEPFGLSYLQTITFILVIATFVQFLEMALRKFIPTLHRSLGVYLPLITTNCAVLGVTVDSMAASYSFAASLFSAVGCGLGFLVAMLLFAGVRSRLEGNGTPRSWRGLPLTLAAAAIVSLSFGGFTGIVSIPSPSEDASLYFEKNNTAGFGNIALDVLVAAGVLFSVSLVAALLLTLASRVFAVKTDDRIPAVRACLPGANCGACGFAGCDGYAEALVLRDAKTNLCIPGADKVAADIAALLGKEAEDVVEQVAVVACDGNCNARLARNTYAGIESCAAAKMQFGGPSACAYGCIGYGDCVAVCPQNAICITDGIARIDSRACVGCGKCATVCPQSVIKMFPDVRRTLVLCQSHDMGAATRKVCKNGCIGCKKCEKLCPHGAVTVVDNLAVIDYEKCENCHACVKVCPTGAIAYADISGFHRHVSAERTSAVDSAKHPIS